MKVPPIGTQARKVIHAYQENPNATVHGIARRHKIHPDVVRRVHRRWQNGAFQGRRAITNLPSPLKMCLMAGDDAGKTDEDLAKEFRLSKAYVRQMRKDYGKGGWLEAGKRRILALRRNHKLTGKTLDEIAERIHMKRSKTADVLLVLEISPFPPALGIDPDEIAETANRMLKRNFADGADMFVQLYHTEKKTLEDIGDMLGFSATWAKRWMERLGIPRRPQGFAGPRNGFMAKPKPKGAPMPET